MIPLRDSLSRKVTAVNLLVSGGALVLALLAFSAYDLFTFRTNIIANTSVQAHMISSNVVSPLIFNDVPAAQNTISALGASKRIVYAGIYTANGQSFAGYWREGAAPSVPLPAFDLNEGERSWFTRDRFSLVQTVFFQGRPVGVVYIQSDLSAIYDRLKSYGLILLAIFLASLAAALAFSRLSQRVISQPILRLAEMATIVSQERDYSIRAPMPKDHDEVAVLVTAFNEMLMEIQKRDSALQESERQFRDLADSIPQLAWMAEPDGELFWYNHRWYEFTGTTPEQMAGWGWQSVHDLEKLPDILTAWRASLATGQAFQMTFPLRGADGEFRLFLTRATPVRDSQGKIARWFGTNTDVTEQHQAEEALRQTEKLAATGRLAASIAHEINNPLEAVTNLVYLAQKQPANVKTYLQLADQELDRIAQITKNTLGFYRDSASPVQMEVAQVLEEVLALYARKLKFKRIVLRKEYEEGIMLVGNPGEIRQIFANLISNAIEALSDEGCLTIRAKKARAANDFSREGVRITFMDNGTGVPPNQMKKIFEAFYTTKKDVGTGLGLWLTRGLVEKHHGSLRVRSSIRPGGTWTAFSVFLPERPLAN